MQLQQDMLFDDRYRLIKLLGRGGFSEVWLVEDTKVGGKKITLKVYAPGIGLDDDGVQLFSNEYELVFDLNHSNLLRTAYFDVCDHSPYLLMQFCEHGSTMKIVGKITEEEAWHYLHDVAAGLAHLHEQDPPIIHQDIKPDNILIDNNGHYLITDFGISAKVRSTLRKSVGTTKSSGTLSYMPPERFGKENIATCAGDIWALGASLFELLTGLPPYGDHGGMLQKSGAEIPNVHGEWSDDLVNMVKSCLSADPQERPSAKQIVELTEEHQKGRDVSIKEKTKKEASPLILFKKTSVAVNKQSQNKEKSSVKVSKKSFKGILLGVIGLLIGAAILFVYLLKSPPKEYREDTIPAKGNQVLRHPAEPEMALVEGGTFIMGCTDETGGNCGDDEKPAHQVTVGSFYMAKHEVTQRQWKAVMNNNPSEFKGYNLPVENVSWDDTNEFISRLNAVTNKNYRLPTEAEWEYAARGGSKNKNNIYSGSQTINDVAWYKDNGGKKTHPVGTKHPNELGLYDMSGNVYEWCSDWYGSYSVSAQNDPQGPSSGSYRVERGGSWLFESTNCRVSARYFVDADFRYSDLGFRLVLPVQLP